MAIEELAHREEGGPDGRTAAAGKMTSTGGRNSGKHGNEYPPPTPLSSSYCTPLIFMLIKKQQVVNQMDEVDQSLHEKHFPQQEGSSGSRSQVCNQN